MNERLDVFGDRRCLLYCRDCLEILPTLVAGSVDAVVTDPPYGLEFMGKDWDKLGAYQGPLGEDEKEGPWGRKHRVRFGKSAANMQEWHRRWAEVALRVAKPGAHLLAFGGTRTFHRLACALEDAGWELRDTIMWVYGSGFPKSLDVSKAIDKAAGAIGGRGDYISADHAIRRKPGNQRMHEGYQRPWRDDPAAEDKNARAYIPATDAARRWQGWGTALKPAVEYVIVAKKPLDLLGLAGIMALKIGGAICQLKSSAKDVGGLSPSSPSEFGAECGSVLWTAAAKCNTPEGLSALMATSRSGLGIPSTLNTALSWLDILGALCQAAKTFTTEMAIGLITDLKILNSLPLPTIADSIIVDVTGQHGTGSNVSLAASIFSVVAVKLASILTSSAPGLATSSDAGPGLHPNWRPIIVARKPLCGTVAENVLAHGTGAINVDGCRIDGPGWTRPDGASGAGFKTDYFMGAAGRGQPTQQYGLRQSSAGRWPANLIHDGSEEVVGLFPKGGASGVASGPTRGKLGTQGRFGPASGDMGESRFYGDSGSAARFFYCAKASKADRDEGCEGLDAKHVGHYAQDEWSRENMGNTPDAKRQPVRNHHPTVKPTALMRYLCRLVTPPGGLILDPFMGSGSTGKAAMLEGFRFVGIELDPEYLAIAERRIHAARPPLFAAEETKP